MTFAASSMLLMAQEQDPDLEAVCEASREILQYQSDSRCDDQAPNTLCMVAGESEVHSFEATATADRLNESQIPLVNIQNVHFEPNVSSQEVWPVGIMHIQTVLPISQTGQTTEILLVGAVDLINLVTPREALDFQHTRPVTASTGINLRSAPSESALILGSVPAGTQLDALGIDTSGLWLRVIEQDKLAWVSQGLVIPELPLDNLPVLSMDSLVPMQSFEFTTDAEPDTCGADLSFIAIRTPGDTAIYLLVNNIPFEVTGLITVRSLPDGQSLDLQVHAGRVDLLNGDVLASGEAAIAEMDSEQNRVHWSQTRLMTDGELQIAEIVKYFLPFAASEFSEFPPTEEIELVYENVTGDTVTATISWSESVPSAETTSTQSSNAAETYVAPPASTSLPIQHTSIPFSTSIPFTATPVPPDPPTSIPADPPTATPLPPDPPTATQMPPIPPTPTARAGTGGE